MCIQVLICTNTAAGPNTVPNLLFDYINLYSRPTHYIFIYYMLYYYLELIYIIRNNAKKVNVNLFRNVHTSARVI